MSLDRVGCLSVNTTTPENAFSGCSNLKTVSIFLNYSSGENFGGVDVKRVEDVIKDLDGGTEPTETFTVQPTPSTLTASHSLTSIPHTQLNSGTYTASPSPNKLGIGVIIGIVIGCVLVVSIVVVIVVLIKKKLICNKPDPEYQSISTVNDEDIP